MSRHFDRFRRNMQRVENLNKLYGKAKESPKRPTVVEADVLRASIVFMHSSFEEYYRAVIIDRLPLSTDVEALKGICLLNSNQIRAERFTLAELKPFCEKTVSTLISDSVRHHMGTKSFSNYTEICSWSRKINIDLDTFSKANEIDAMIKRRHKIVHEADLNYNSGRGHHRATPINLTKVQEWAEAVTELVSMIDQQCDLIID